MLSAKKKDTLLEINMILTAGRIAGIVVLTRQLSLLNSRLTIFEIKI